MKKVKVFAVLFAAVLVFSSCAGKNDISSVTSGNVTQTEQSSSGTSSTAQNTSSKSSNNTTSKNSSSKQSFTNTSSLKSSSAAQSSLNAVSNSSTNVPQDIIQEVSGELFTNIAKTTLMPFPLEAVGDTAIYADALYLAPISLNNCEDGCQEHKHGIYRYTLKGGDLAECEQIFDEPYGYVGFCFATEDYLFFEQNNYTHHHDAPGIHSYLLKRYSLKDKTTETIACYESSTNISYSRYGDYILVRDFYNGSDKVKDGKTDITFLNFDGDVVRELKDFNIKTNGIITATQAENYFVWNQNNKKIVFYNLDTQKVENEFSAECQTDKFTPLNCTVNGDKILFNCSEGLWLYDITRQKEFIIYRAESEDAKTYGRFSAVYSALGDTVFYSDDYNEIYAYNFISNKREYVDSCLESHGWKGFITDGKTNFANIWFANTAYQLTINKIK